MNEKYSKIKIVRMGDTQNASSEYAIYQISLGDEILGGARVRFEGENADLMSLIIFEEHRRNGLATKLLDIISRNCKDENIKSITCKIVLKSDIGHDSMCRFYEKSGFVEHDLIKFRKAL